LAIASRLCCTLSREPRHYGLQPCDSPPASSDHICRKRWCEATIASVSPTVSSPASAAISITSRRSSFSKATSRIPRSRVARSLGWTTLLHQAAIPSVPRSVHDPITSNRANIDASLNVLCAARDAGVKRLVYAGSSSENGDTPTLPNARHAAEPSFAIRAAETRRRAVLPDVHGDDTRRERAIAEALRPRLLLGSSSQPASGPKGSSRTRIVVISCTLIWTGTPHGWSSARAASIGSVAR
jgi:hypothetical protein